MPQGKHRRAGWLHAKTKVKEEDLWPRTKRGKRKGLGVTPVPSSLRGTYTCTPCCLAWETVKAAKLQRGAASERALLLPCDWRSRPSHLPGLLITSLEAKQFNGKTGIGNLEGQGTDQISTSKTWRALFCQTILLLKTRISKYNTL